MFTATVTFLLQSGSQTGWL